MTSYHAADRVALDRQQRDAVGPHLMTSQETVPFPSKCYSRSMSASRPYSVEVELPAEAFRHRPWSASEVSSDLRLLWLVDQVRHRRLGYATAADLAGMAQAAFVKVLGAHHISPIDLDDQELDREILAGTQLGRL